MQDWQLFVDQIPWFLEPQDQVIVGEGQPWSRGSVDNLPELSALLASATVTPISIAGSAYELLGWGAPDNRRGWLGLPQRFSLTPSTASHHYPAARHTRYSRSAEHLT